MMFSKRLSRDMAIRQAPVSRGFIQHDGVLHTFCDEVLTAAQEGSPGVERFLAGRAVVHLVARQPETVLARIKKRRLETGEIRGNNYPGLDDADVLAMTLQKDLQRRLLCTVCEGMGLPVLRLVAEDDVEVNLRHVIEFETSLLAGATLKS